MRLEGKGLFQVEGAQSCSAYVQGHQDVQKQLQC